MTCRGSRPPRHEPLRTRGEIKEAEAAKQRSGGAAEKTFAKEALLCCQAKIQSLCC